MNSNYSKKKCTLTKAYGISQNQFLHQPPDPLSGWPKAPALVNA